MESQTFEEKSDLAKQEVNKFSDPGDHVESYQVNCEANGSAEPACPRTAGIILGQCDYLIDDAKNFNLHAKILKKLLNLKERVSGYEMYQKKRSTSEQQASTEQAEQPSTQATKGLPPNPDSSSDLVSIQAKIAELRRELEESHKLGFCLVYNIQCLQKRLTGSPIDINCGAALVKQLQEKHDASKTHEAILKYEFQEKRKLLRRLRHQLEETRDDWRCLRIRKRRPEDEQEDLLWSEALRREFANKRKQPSEESGFIEPINSGPGGGSTSAENSPGIGDVTSEGGSDQAATTSGSEGGDSSYEDLAVAMDNRRAKLDFLEDECYNLFTALASRHELSQSNRFESVGRGYGPQILIPDGIPDHLLVDVDDEDEDDNEVDLSDPLSDEFDELNLHEAFPTDVLDPLEPIDNTEEADMSDLPWDSNLYESRTTSLTTESIFPTAIEPTISTQSAESPTNTVPLAPSISTVNIGVGSDRNFDEDDDDEYTRQEMESIAETGEPLVLCRLRRRAVEILVSRLRDEKALHESRESELKEQLEEVKRLNEKLQNQINSIKSSDSSSSNCPSILLSIITTLIVTTSVITYLMR